ncbi:MFS transporter [Pseudogemmobacter sonorensis]|uniref:MFS transporter n=1 Tax=Pseudogemmobacter sonorensis TaxID=2989681 RepID=UPI00369F3FE2
MLRPLANRTYRHLFAAQVVALLGTGLMTVALGLLAYDLAGERAGAVLGTALAIKMVAYVAIAPLAQALTERLPRRAVMVGLDLVRAGVALFLPFVTEVWQVWLLIFLLQAASAGFTPMFQAVIPDILPKEEEYTRALSLSRLAYDLESLLSPALAVAALSVMSFHGLFAGTTLGFLLSAALVLSVAIPTPAPDPGAARRGIWDRTLRGSRIYFATPRLRGLFAMTLTLAAAGSMVIVNTVTIVKVGMGLGEPQVALALAAFGAGSMLAALALPALLDRVPDRAVMIGASALLVLAAFAGAMVRDYPALLALWLVTGVGFSASLTPSGRLLRRSATSAERPALFAAHFALSHGCWLVFYPLAGWLALRVGMPATFVTHGVLAALALAAGIRLWPPEDAAEGAGHSHPDLPPDHPHLLAHGQGAAHRHGWLADGLHPPRG